MESVGETKQSLEYCMYNLVFYEAVNVKERE